MATNTANTTTTNTQRTGQYAAHTVVGICTGNPKKAGTASHTRWAASAPKVGQVVSAFTAPAVQGGLTSADMQWGTAANRTQFVLAAPNSPLLAAYQAHAKAPTATTLAALLKAWPKAATGNAGKPGACPLPVLAGTKAKATAKAA